MLLPVVLLVLVAVSLALYAWFRGMAGGKTYWSTVAAVVLGTSASRIAAVVLGVYILEHDSGWWQVPAYAMAVLGGFPEMALMRNLSGSLQSLAQLGVFLIAGTTLWVGTIALLAARRRG